MRRQESEGSQRITQSGPTSVACLVLVDSSNSVLIAQRPIEKQLGGLWEFPGGKVESGESAEVALRRELSEELQLEVVWLQPLPPVTYIYEFGTIELIPFLSRCDNRPAVHLMEHSNVAWVSCADFFKYEWAPADIPVVEDLMAILCSNEIQQNNLSKT